MNIIKNKKSQITIFIMLGVVIILIAAFFFYIQNYSVKTSSGTETKRASKIKVNLQPIENYVSQCLKKTIEDGIVKMGKQGGYLFSSQGGPLIDYKDSDEGIFFVSYNDYMVSYLIKPLKSDIGKYNFDSPLYPWKTFPYKDALKSEETFKGIFGESALLNLNSSYGANSIKTQLEYYIEKNIVKCAQWTPFADEFEITSSKPKADVAITKEGTTVHLKFPLKLKQISTGATTEMQDFYSKNSIALGKVYSQAKKVIEQDISQIDYSIENSFLGEGISLEIIRDHFNNDDIIIIKDSNSLVKGASYEFIFARKNRKPALYYISPEEIIMPDLHEIVEQDLIDGGISALKAIDPDEDLVSYSIDPAPPITLRLPKKDFKIIAKEEKGELEDFQIVSVLREERT